MPRYYAVALTPCNGGFGEWERSVYGGDYARTIKGAVQRATGGEHEPERHARYLIGRDDEKVVREWGEEWHHGDIRGLIHDEPEHVYLVETLYGLRYVGVTAIREVE